MEKILYNKKREIRKRRGELMLNDNLASTDMEVFSAITQERERQQNKIELIASENFTSNAVMEAMGSVLTNKYAEGYPGKRYYGGCEFVDIVENLAIDRAKQLFRAEHVNVQPHSGAQANMAVYFSVLEPGDTILGMNLAHGGHLTHGSPVNFSGKMYQIVPYCVKEQDGTLDYEEIERLAITSKPKLIVAGASAYPRKIDFAKFRQIADKVGAYLMVDMAHIAGIVAAGLHQNPVDYADFVTTTTHKTLRGPRGGMILCKEKYAQLIDKSIFPGVQGGPLMHVIAGKAVCLKEALGEGFKTYQQQVLKNAQALATRLIEKKFELVSGGTDNHLILMDLTNQHITGKEAEVSLDEVGITVNKNSIPYDKQKPNVTSGIRIGTPAMTTRGMIEEDMVEIADLIDLTLKKGEKEQVKKRVQNLCQKYPLY